ncbi:MULTISPECIES: D-alanine--poly(phosphoribitol) ligase subunit DltA [Enterococcus]|uniref:D-alanine--D-alanyl carrier protein ligase n=1 Tax=Enterococcus sulfureus ATCC 49903 TaxID=1140003 RepID=S0P9Y2_9ENTE|nr:D-alanine--poly(phosphoribitol) ligase subunit DltA [Enterococcus sulfureus]EOT51428.1 D-alanine-poly(phosphoribitol) ligase, subunit 1 [Enterococcus sulfureus ATCC 49903]EOT87085.1 D-alanine-poly(phosphoribitol) ligase, subunit 1 [Enterococcus sulfureus ATCC 49903]
MNSNITNKNRLLYQVIDEWAQTDPERIVYQHHAMTYTYGQLKTYSDRVASYLSKHFKNREPIVVFGGQQMEMLVLFLAASKSGHPYIPIDTHTPNERIDLILSVANPTMIFAVDDWPLHDTAYPVVTSEELSLILEEISEIDIAKGITREEVYYIIFTSGTTGIPKGVQISHENLWSFVEWECTQLSIQSGDRFLSQAPFSFDLSVMSVYPALVRGGALVPMEKETIEDFKQLFQVLPTLPIDVWVSTPSFMDICLMEPTFDQQHVPQLRVFLFCGEELTPETARLLLTRFPEATIYNTYGPTEATVAISAVKVTQELLTQYPRVPIGYVKSDTRVLIMEEEQICGIDEKGEIVIVGPSVSKGYLNNPEKTAQAFFEYEGQRAYKTGDAGYMTADGMLCYDGRLDFQVKLNGYRMELEEIDHHLMHVSLVKQASVVPKYKEHKVQQLVAYVVTEPHEYEKAFQLTKAIKSELATQVMPYMIPQKFVYVDQLPRTANGKIDRKALIAEVNPL